jgi:hypothetical protein
LRNSFQIVHTLLCVDIVLCPFTMTNQTIKGALALTVVALTCASRNVTLTECFPEKCAGRSRESCSGTGECKFNEKLGCFPTPGSCCLTMMDSCNSPDVELWPCCCPGYALLPAGCTTPCNTQLCGCTGKFPDGSHDDCCKPSQPCLDGAQRGISQPICCPGGASGSGLCENNVCIQH